MIINCEDLNGHWKDICLGTYTKANGQPHSLRTRKELLSRYLRIDASEVEIPKSPVDPIPSSGIGDRMKEIIIQKVGATPCGSCKAEIEKLNLMTAEQVHAEKHEIAAGIVTRAQEKAPKWWQRWGATLAPGLAEIMVYGWIDEACGITNPA